MHRTGPHVFAALRTGTASVEQRTNYLQQHSADNWLVQVDAVGNPGRLLPRVVSSCAVTKITGRGWPDAVRSSDKSKADFLRSTPRAGTRVKMEKKLAFGDLKVVK